MKTELEQFAEDYVSEQFDPLFKNDVFWLNHLKDNQNAYWAFYQEIMDRWIIQEEPEDSEEELFDLMCNKENGGT